jgi:hypothetical protein
MEKYLFPWKSNVMIHEPWIMPIYLFVLALLLSIITWIREKKH